MYLTAWEVYPNEHNEAWMKRFKYYTEKNKIHIERLAATMRRAV